MFARGAASLNRPLTPKKTERSKTILEECRLERPVVFTMQHTLREEFRGIAIFIGLMWAVWLVDLFLPLDLSAWGIQPRTLTGLIGIPLMPFLHSGLGHLLSNTIPLAILLALLAGSRASSWQIVCELVLLGGVLLWCLGRSNANHVGASGLIYGLIAFLIVSGFLEKRLVPLGIAILVGFVYGSTLLFGVLPTLDHHVSWDGHLFGALAGAALAYIHNRQDESLNPALA